VKYPPIWAFTAMVEYASTAPMRFSCSGTERRTAVATVTGTAGACGGGAAGLLHATSRHTETLSARWGANRVCTEPYFPGLATSVSGCGPPPLPGDPDAAIRAHRESDATMVDRARADDLSLLRAVRSGYRPRACPIPHIRG